MPDTVLIFFGAALALAAVIVAADCLIHYSIVVAARLHAPSFLIGVLIVGAGTSAPEAMVSLFAGLDGKADLSVGNAAGSNIVNTALLALTLMLYPCLHPSAQARVILLLLAILHILVCVLIDASMFEVTDGLILLSIGGLYILASLYAGARRKAPAPAAALPVENGGGEQQLLAPALGLCVLISLTFLLLGAHYFVGLTVLFCQTIGISDLFIGLTVVALGTSLPEVSASLQAARRGASDISLGNMLGSMTFNLSAVFSFATFSGDVLLDEHFFARDYYCLVISFLLCCAMYLLGGRPGALRALCALIMLLYLAYTAALFQDQFL